MLQKYRGETVNFDSRKVRKFKGFEFPRPDDFIKRGKKIGYKDVTRLSGDYEKGQYQN